MVGRQDRGVEEAFDFVAADWPVAELSDGTASAYGFVQVHGRVVERGYRVLAA
jgi:hypothetical protein